MTMPKLPFKVVCVDDHANMFESREGLLAARERRKSGREAPSDGLSISLTVGKTYTVKRERLGMYAIRDDTNGVYLFPKALFRRVRLRSVAPAGRTRDRA